MIGRCRLGHRLLGDVAEGLTAELRAGRAADMIKTDLELPPGDSRRDYALKQGFD